MGLAGCILYRGETVMAGRLQARVLACLGQQICTSLAQAATRVSCKDVE